MTIYETERTIVRLWREGEADRVFDILSREEVARWLGTAAEPMSDRAQALERIAVWRERTAADPRLGTWAIELKATGVAVGSVTLALLPDGDGEVEVGWHLHPDAWGRGLASEAARGALAKGFAAGLPRIYAVTHVTNAPSIRVCRAIGMRDLGVVHDRWYEGVSHLFRMTRAEHESRPRPPS